MRTTLISMLALLAAGAAEAGPLAKQGPSSGAPWQRMLFLTPMGEPFRATEPGQRGIDLWFTAADADHDGKLSRDEYLADASRFFDRLDANHDASATSAESTALWERNAPEMLGAADMRPPLMDQPIDDSSNGHHAHHDAAGGGDSVFHPNHSGARPIEPRQGAARFSLLRDVEPVMTCDTDFNRRITRDEFAACATRRFAEIDVNGDGFFTPDEAGGREH